MPKQVSVGTSHWVSSVVHKDATPSIAKLEFSSGVWIESPKNQLLSWSEWMIPCQGIFYQRYSLPAPLPGSTRRPVLRVTWTRPGCLFQV